MCCSLLPGRCLARCIILEFCTTLNVSLRALSRRSVTATMGRKPPEVIVQRTAGFRYRPLQTCRTAIGQILPRELPDGCTPSVGRQRSCGLSLNADVSAEETLALHGYRLDMLTLPNCQPNQQLADTLVGCVRPLRSLPPRASAVACCHAIFAQLWVCEASCSSASTSASRGSASAMALPRVFADRA